MSVFDMIKNIYKKNSAQKQTADSSKTVSRVKTTSSNDGARNRNTNTQKSEASYWQATQQTQNQKSTQKAKQQMSMPKVQKATRQSANKRDKESADKAQKYAEAQKKARSYNPEKQYDYGQANAGLEELFKNPIKALNGGTEKAMRRYYDANRKLVKHDTQRRQKQAEAAQAQIDLTKEALEQHPDLKAWSDLGLSTLGGLTSGVGGLLKTGTTLARGIAGATGNRDTEKKLRQWEADLGVDQALQNVNEGNLVANNMMGQVAQSVGNMIPTIAANALTGGGAGLGVMGASVFGNEGSEALNRLASDGRLTREDAVRGLTTGALKAGLEVGSESITGLIPGLETFAFTNPNHLLGQAGGEALEEMFSSAVEPVIDPMADPNVGGVSDYAQTAYNNTFGNASQYGRDIAQSGLLGAATSLAMGVPANIIANQQTTAETPEQTQQAKPVQPVTEPQETMQIPTEAEPVVANVEETLPVPEEAEPIPEPHEEQTPKVSLDPNIFEGAEQQTQVQPKLGEVENPTKTNIKDLWSADKTSPKYQQTVNDMSDKIKQIVRGDQQNTNSKVSDEALEYILGHVREAVTSGDQKAIKASANEVINAIAADTNIPPEIVERIKGGRDVNQTTERLSEGERIGLADEKTTELTANENKQEIEAGSSEATYDITQFKELRAIAQEEYTKLGSMDRAYADFMGTRTGKTTGQKVKSLFNGMRGINTDYDMAINLAKGQYLKGQMEIETQKLINDIEAKGYKVNPVVSLTGDTTYQLVKDGKIVDPPEMRDAVKTLTEQRAKYGDVELKLKNIGHNLGTFLGMFRADSFSPASQVKEFNTFIEALNKNLDKKFGSKIKSGELSHVKLNEELVKQFLAAETDADRTELIGKMAVDIESQVPHTFLEKLDTFRYNNLLFNPLTWVRNTVGNAGQSAMANAKDITLYALESYLKARGVVRYNNIDMSNKADRAIYNHADLTTRKTLTNDFAEAKKSGNAKKYLKSLGYEGGLLNAMLHFKGETFNLASSNPVLNERLTEKIANNAKEAGYKVDNGKLLDKNGKEITDKAYRELLSDSYKSAKKQWLSADDLRMAKNGSIGKGMAHKTQRQLFWNEGFDILNPQHESIAGMLSDGSTNPDILKAKFKEAHRKNVFSNNNPFGWLQNKQSDIIDYVMNDMSFTGDDWWIRSGYSKNMARMLDAQGYHAEINNDIIELFDESGDKINQGEADAILNKINADAYQRALEDTYHDANELANLLNDVERMGGLAKLLMNAIQPFIKTPLNITRRAIEYSPIGLIDSVRQLNKVKAGEISASTWLNSIAKGSTGATAMIIGAWLASMGFLRAAGDDDDENITRFESAEGLQNYSVQIPGLDGWSATVDWLAPGIAPVLLGAAMQEKHEQYVPRSTNETTVQRTWNILGEDIGSLGTLFRPIADTTMLSGLMDAISSATDEEGNLDPNGIMASVTQNYVRQLTPVLGSKIQGIIDPVKYSTSSDSFFDRQIRAAAINMRLIDFAMTAMNGEPYLQPQLDLDGKPIETEDYGLGAPGRAITNLLNPTTVKHDSRDETDLELERLYNATGNQYILPYIRASVKNDNVYTKFTPKERTEFNQYLLPNYKAAAEEFMASRTYNDYTDKEKSDILNAMANHFFTEAKAKYLGRVIPNADQVLTPRDKACDLVNSFGISTSHFYGYIYTDFEKDSDGNTINNTRAMKVRAQMEADGIYSRVQKAIEYGLAKPSDFQLNNAVLGWDTEDFTYYYNKMLDGKYDGKNVKKSKR